MPVSFMELARCIEVKIMEKIDLFKRPTGPGCIERCTYFFKEANKEMSYAQFVPECYDGNTPMPMVVLLHGMYSTPHQIIRLRGFAAEANTRGYIVVAPYGYDSKSWYGIKDTGYVDHELSELSEKDVMNVLNIAREELNIDSKRIYLTGHSMGGAGTLHLGAAYAHIWAALAPMSPPIIADPAPALASLPVLIITGESDRVTPAKPVREWVDKARKHGMECEYEEVSGGGHLFVVNKPDLFAQVFDFFDRHTQGDD